jgi:hypothetical protein
MIDRTSGRHVAIVPKDNKEGSLCVWEEWVMACRRLPRTMTITLVEVADKERVDSRKEIIDCAHFQKALNY